MEKSDYVYRVEISCWTRSRDGDDWIDTEYQIIFDDFIKAIEYIKTQKYTIETRIIIMKNGEDILSLKKED
jgi:hypothetical protein